MTDIADPGPDPSPDRDHPDQTAQAGGARRHRRTQRLVLTTNDVDLLAEILKPSLGLIATVRVAGQHDTLNVWLDELSTDGQQPQLVYRHVDDALQPASVTNTVDVASITHLHLW